MIKSVNNVNKRKSEKMQSASTSKDYCIDKNNIYQLNIVSVRRNKVLTHIALYYQIFKSWFNTDTHLMNTELKFGFRVHLNKIH